MKNHFISAQELSQCYQQDNVVVVDCRFSLADTSEGERHYQQGHIPGARYLHLDRDMSGAKGRHGGRHPLPEQSAFVDVLRRIGIDSSPEPSLVVVYDDQRFAFAARLWWMLRYYGHRHVKVLAGGFQAWCAQGFSVDSEQPRPATGNFEAAIQADSVVEKHYVETIEDKPTAVLIDSRERPRYLGKEEPIDPVAGHIDGAINYPWHEAVDEQGLMPRQLQQQRFDDLLHIPEIVVYCGSGVTACVNVLSLATLGREDAKLYVGSWSDWCSYF